ncbi:MAG: endolytic transglycosylase MltG [Bacteroidia bacterium]|nr:endolytic transglycosylase MltG [Bacteroidia bacterium]
MKRFLTNPITWLLILGAGAILGYQLVYKPLFGTNVKTADGKDMEFFIPRGYDYKEVGDKLLREKLIKDPQSFHWLARKMNYPKHVYPGRYIIKDGMSNRELITLLRSGSREAIDFTFVKFRTKEDLAKHVGERLEMSSSDFLAVLNDEEFLKKQGGLNPELAMMVFIPNTYKVHWHISPKEFYKKMYSEYQKFWTAERNKKREKFKLNRREIMTIASIVEEETNKNDEKSRVAGVYLNRVRKKWPLEADPTVKYAVGDFTIKRVLFKHLKFDSPYNTYLYPGIPPGPICTPSIPSIDAVLNAEKHEYMFFCARIDGSGYHQFSETLAAHNAYAAKYQRMLDQMGIR